MSRRDAEAKLTLPVGERDHSQGPADARVVLLEYGDFECPYCGQAYPIVKQIQREMGRRLRFVFRNFPLREIHPNAEHAAEAAEAAGAQRKFWEMHDRLFERQFALQDDNLGEYAGDLGLDVVRFQNELTERKHEPRVREDFRSGVSSGVNGTPTFFIDGVRHDASWDAATLLAALEQTARRNRGSGLARKIFRPV